MRWHFLGVSIILALLAAAASAAVTMPMNGTTPAPTGTANAAGRGVSAGVGPDGKFQIMATEPDPPLDQSIHFEWCFDEGLPSESKNKKSGKDKPGGGKSYYDSSDIPSGAKTVHWVIYFDTKNAAGEETWTWATSGTINL